MIYTSLGKTAGNIIMFLLICVSMGINCFIVNHYELRVGVLATENYLLMDHFYSKPWTKLSATALGVYAASLYMDILKYRKCQGEEEKKDQFPWLHYLHKSPALGHLMFHTGLICFIIGLTIGCPAIADPYSWSNLQNMIGFSVFRFIFTFGLFLTLLPQFLGHANFFHQTLRAGNFLCLAKTTYIIALLYPVFIGLLYNTRSEALFL